MSYSTAFAKRKSLSSMKQGSQEIVFYADADFSVNHSKSSIPVVSILILPFFSNRRSEDSFEYAMKKLTPLSWSWMLIVASLFG